MYVIKSTMIEFIAYLNLILTNNYKKCNQSNNNNKLYQVN